jgi:hypothetical protein
VGDTKEASFLAKNQFEKCLSVFVDLLTNSNYLRGITSFRLESWPREKSSPGQTLYIADYGIMSEPLAPRSASSEKGLMRRMLLVGSP